MCLEVLAVIVGGTSVNELQQLILNGRRQAAAKVIPAFLVFRGSDLTEIMLSSAAYGERIRLTLVRWQG